jgi:hypothetical protein
LKIDLAIEDSLRRTGHEDRLPLPGNREQPAAGLKIHTVIEHATQHAGHRSSTCAAAARQSLARAALIHAQPGLRT